MATPEELRERLRAKRDAQLQQQQHAESVHAQARQAVQDLIVLGYDFPQILEQAKGQISAETLDLHYKALGYFRRKEQPPSGTSRWDAASSFGSPRWLQNVKNYTISLEESEPESASEDDSDDALPDDIRPDGGAVSAASSAGPSQSDTDMPDAEATAPEGMAPASGGHRSGDLQLPIVGSTEPKEPVAADEQHAAMSVDSGALPEPSASVAGPMDAQMAKVPPQVPSSGSSMSGIAGSEPVAPPHPRASGFAPPSLNRTSSHSSATASRPSEAARDLDLELHDSAMSTERESEPAAATSAAVSAAASAIAEGQAGLGASRVEAGTDDSEAESSSEDESETPALEDSIKEELRRVQDQVRAMQERKLAKEAQREAEAAMQKRTAELSDIAAKRAVLMQARQQLNLPKLTSRVSRLESKLKNAKELVLGAAVQLKDINAQSLELEKKEIQIRNELVRPAPPRDVVPAITTTAAAAEHDKAQVASDAASDAALPLANEAEAPPPRERVKVLTAEDSPLRMFGSWRLAPLGPRHWFSPSFNGRFVRDLDVREFCNVDLTGEACVDRDCEFVHYRDFEVPPHVVVEYMATRGVERPGFKDGLVQALRTHLSGPDATPEQLAAVAVGFRQQYDAQQVLDWDSWGVARPL